MSDTPTTRSELDRELSSLRFRLHELEARREDLDSIDERSSPRRPESVRVQFVSEFGQLEAAGIDRSDEGVQIQLPRAMRFTLQLEEDADHVRRCAELVWARRQEDGSMRLGFQFVESHPRSAF